MLRDGCNDWNVNLRISGIPERIETSSPWSNDSRNGQQDKSSKSNDEDRQDETSQKGSKLLAWNARSNELDEANELQKSEDTKGRHMLATANWQKTDERNLHAGQRAECVPTAVADVESRAVSSHADQDKDVERDQVGDENVSAPSRNHVAVEQGTQCTPECGSELHSLDPQIERKDEQENGNGLIVIAASN